MKQIIVDIDKKGNVKIEAEGYTGASCKTATEFLEKALGKKKKEELKSEYFLEETVKNNINIGNY
jgi:hypothetical protein